MSLRWLIRRVFGRWRKCQGREESMTNLAKGTGVEVTGNETERVL